MHLLTRDPSFVASIRMYIVLNSVETNWPCSGFAMAVLGRRVTCTSNNNLYNQVLNKIKNCG